MTDATLLKVARAIERGTLPRAIHVSGNRHTVNLQAPYPEAHAIRAGLDLSDALATWAAHAYPDGRLTVEQVIRRQVNRQPARYLDRVRYWSAPITATFYREHLHPFDGAGLEYKADTRDRTKRGHVQWLHVCCSQRVTITEARRLGLAP